MIPQRSRRDPLVELAIDIAVETNAAPVNEEHANRLFHHALRCEGRNGTWHFAIRLISDREMSGLHKTWLNDPSPTDILTFPYDADDDVSGGDIVISLDTAARNAIEAGWDVAQELDFLMLHGLLHVIGWTDHSSTQRAAMLRRQHELLRSWRQSRVDS